VTAATAGAFARDRGHTVGRERPILPPRCCCRAVAASRRAKVRHAQAAKGPHHGNTAGDGLSKATVASVVARPASPDPAAATAELHWTDSSVCAFRCLCTTVHQAQNGIQAWAALRLVWLLLAGRDCSSRNAVNALATNRGRTAAAPGEPYVPTGWHLSLTSACWPCQSRNRRSFPREPHIHGSLIDRCSYAAHDETDRIEQCKQQHCERSHVQRRTSTAFFETNLCCS
jgi:hypothetical protein